MTGAQDDGWWQDCPLPDVPLLDLPDDPELELEPEDDVVEMLRAERMRNAADGQIALRILQLLRTTTPVGPISPRDLVAAEIGAALALGSGAALRLVDVSVALHERL